MNKLMQWMMAAILICGATVFTSCSNEDNSVNPGTNLAEKIIGKWMMNTDFGGQPALTNNKEVITFVSPTKAYVSRSHGVMGDNPELQPSDQENLPDDITGAPGWDDEIECDVKIEGSLVILTSDGPNGSKNTIKYQIKSISQTDFFCEITRDAPGGNPPSPDGENPDGVRPDGDKPMNEMPGQRYTRVTRDFDEAIIGLWECKGLKGGETFNDANARLEFFEDGTYNFYHKNDAGEWEAVTTREFQEYFVDGVFLCTRWKNIEEDELREWWEIVNIKGDKMQWKALRENQDEDHTTYEQIVDWEKVEE